MKRRPEHKPLAPAPDRHEAIALERLIFFSDAVFAIAITLLALDIRLPDAGPLTESDLSQALLNQWHAYLGFTISFMVIGLFWFGHHRKFKLIGRSNTTLLFINLVLLMGIAFIPFPAAVLSQYGNRTATIFYALVMALVSLVSAAQWGYALFRGLVDPAVSSAVRRKEILIPLANAGVFLLSVGIAFLNDDAAKASWVLVIFTSTIH